MNKIKINDLTVIYQGDNTDVLAKFPENYFDSIVCDPYMGSGTTGIAASHLGYRFVGIELKEDYFEIAHHRLLGAK